MYGCFGLDMNKMWLEAGESYHDDIVYGYKSLIRVAICNKSNKLKKDSPRVELLDED